MLLVLTACGGLTTSGAPDASSSGDSADAGGSCASGVCGTAESIGSGAQCAQQFPSSDCLEGVCCVLAADAGPPFVDAAVDCFCASPDDIACAGWYRLPGGPGGNCGYGSLCCGSGGGADR
jgi:hypothetical protein